MKFIKETTKYGLLFSLFAIAATFPLDYRLSNPWIVTLVIFWVMGIFLGMVKVTSLKTEKWKSWSLYAFLIFFLWNLVSLFYSDDLSNGFKAVEGKLSLAVFPLVLYTIQLSQKRIWWILRLFYASIALASFYLLLNSAMHYFSNGSWLTYHDFTAPFDAHAVFFSYFLFLSIMIGVYELNNHKITKVHRILLVTVLGVSFIGLLFCASKNVSIVTVFFSLVILIRRFFKKGFRMKEVLTLVIGLAVIIVAALQMETVKSRMAELSSGSGMENFEIISSGGAIDVFDNKKYNGTSLRLSLWYLGIDELIERDRLLIGLSPADRRAIMNQKYYEVGMGPYQNYNLHNQLIQTLVELGIIGLVLYLFVYIALLGLALHRSNQLLLVFLMATLIFQLTESILERNKVIVFIMFFYCLLSTLKQPADNEGRHTGN